MSTRAKTPDGYPLAPSPVTIMDARGMAIARVESGTRVRVDAKTGATVNMFPSQRHPHRAYPTFDPTPTLNSLVPIRKKSRKRE